MMNIYEFRIVQETNTYIISVDLGDGILKM